MKKKKKMTNMRLAMLAAGVWLRLLGGDAGAQTISFLFTFGSTELDRAAGVAVRGTSLYVVGATKGTLSGQTSSGGFDAFVRKYDICGDLQWTRQFGTSGDDEAFAVAVDSTGVYVAGKTSGSLSGDSNPFVRKYDTNGGLVWTHEFGGEDDEQASGVAVDATGVYVVGASVFSTGFLRKLDLANGSVLCDDPNFGFGYTNNVTVDGSDLFAVEGSAPGNDFLRRADPNCQDLGSVFVQTGSSAGLLLDVAADSGGIYAVGKDGAQQSTAQALVFKYDRNFATTSFDWVDVFNSGFTAFPEHDDAARGVAVDGSRIYVAGIAAGAFPGQTSSGSSDAFLRAYSPAGTVLWTKQFGTANHDHALDVAADGSAVYVVGAFGGDAFLAKFLPQTAVQIHHLAELVGRLGGLDGALSDGQHRSLAAKVERARVALLDDQPRVAANTLTAFSNEVVSLQDEGVLTPERSRELVASAAALIAILLCP
jgi:hypothetical protein